MIHKELSSYFDGAFKDKRIDERANSTLDSIIKKGSVVINQCCSTLAERIGAYRMFGNEKWTEYGISKRVYENCKEHVKSSHVLCIQDTSEINYSGHMGRIGKEDGHIGPVTKNSNTAIQC